MNYESIIKEQIEVLKERQKVAGHEDAMKISSEIRCWMQKAVDLGIKTAVTNGTAKTANVVNVVMGKNEQEQKRPKKSEEPKVFILEQHEPTETFIERMKIELDAQEKKRLIEELKRSEDVSVITARANTKYHIDAEYTGKSGEGPAVILVVPTC